MAPYLATATIGNFQLTRGKIAGINSLVAVDPRVAKGSRAALRKQGAMLRLWKRLFGPYPFSDTGVIADYAPKVGYALETQTRPLFDEAVDSITLAHELAHQWFGDSVGLQQWPDMWLNEGFATWAEWRWREEQGGSTTKQTFRLGMSSPPSSRIWAFPSAVIPEPSQLFASPVYVRGGLALEALRQRIGDRDFFAILRAWASTYSHSTANTADFIALADAQSGEDLDSFFQRWLYKPGKP
jgi:aminopeptidase N